MSTSVESKGSACEIDLLGEITKAAEEMYDEYDLVLQVRDNIMGGVPKVLEVAVAKVEALHRAKKLTDEVCEKVKAELAQQFAEAESVRSATADANGTEDESDEAKEKKASDEAAKHVWTGFHSDDKGIYIEERCFKTALKDALSTLNIFSADRGSKGAHNMGFFIEPNRLRLEREGKNLLEPDGTDPRPAHINGPQGKRSCLKLVDYVIQPTIRMRIKLVHGAKLTQEHIIRALALGQDLGFGAMRSQGFGKFDIVSFKKVIEGTRGVDKAEKAAKPKAGKGKAKAAESPAEPVPADEGE